MRSIIVIDGFYSNPNEVREWALEKDFSVEGNYPGKRTVPDPFETNSLRSHIEGILSTKCTRWTHAEYNGSYQICTKDTRETWIHADKNNHWSVVVYLTPAPPRNSGTLFYEHDDTGKRLYDNVDGPYIENEGQEWDKWTPTDQVQNVYNRALFFRGDLWHCAAQPYFGESKEDGRLIQTFFFDV